MCVCGVSVCERVVTVCFFDGMLYKKTINVLKKRKKNPVSVLHSQLRSFAKKPLSLSFLFIALCQPNIKSTDIQYKTDWCCFCCKCVLIAIECPIMWQKRMQCSLLRPKGSYELPYWLNSFHYLSMNIHFFIHFFIPGSHLTASRVIYVVVNNTLRLFSLTWAQFQVKSWWWCEKIS